MVKLTGCVAGFLAVFSLFTGCLPKSEKSGGGTSSSSSKSVIKIGYAQAGHESDWRIANTESFKNTFTSAKGYEFYFDDADGSVEKQVAAVKDFIDKKVDYIVLASVVETGWDDVLADAKKAGIPVILSDRQIKVADESLYLCWVGGNFLREGRDSVKWLEKYLDKTGKANKKINIVDIQGAMGSSAQIGRTKGIEEGVRMHDNWNLIAQQCGEWSEDIARDVMKDIIAKKGINNIDVVFAENDNMA
ncbi:MAG: substrate-binding domain-containing protein, partial [Treponema sp.]|nr:substrate-binding domain-containing protein [Treponema sp.]